MRIAYLGPEGTFTHQAARTWAQRSAGTPVEEVPLGTVGQVHDAVSSGAVAGGVVAIESSVEGHVVPSLDALLGSADVVAVDEVVLDVSFDAFVRPGHGELTEATAHPHGLAQCHRFVAGRGLTPVPAASNAAACRDVDRHQVALGPRLCGELYGLETLAEAVEDFAGARTRFLVLDRRERAAERFAVGRSAAPDGETSWRTMLAVTPVVTGPGVLARVTDAFGARGVNMSSLVTRPLKARQGQYVFVVTLDAAPWQPGVQELFRDLLGAGDALKVLGAYPAEPGEGGLEGRLAEHVPLGSVRAHDPAAVVDRGLLW
ncbi:prephenate dehydratase [Isoptericola sp. CG 20/1183]|uniref:Prephenate dehydratase n=1 Tax=Isoptericola halotolerans TaxID=300560 RepID=A0ABX5EHK4_9MICO|nr:MULTISPECIES: prephenate dehydratase domain-containing protein [Isoptericola]PRZ07753.1 prephenate dehydratase [Isoptericola halotolerans]PRZ07888.1 prephenate dehydratase [Isoptericola sp. CG 20/1183]